MTFVTGTGSYGLLGYRPLKYYGVPNQGTGCNMNYYGVPSGVLPPAEWSPIETRKIAFVGQEILFLVSHWLKSV